MTQTAVEWFAKELNNWRIKVFGEGAIIGIPIEVFEQAKAMEKNQMIQARITSPLLASIDKDDYIKEAEQYYNETYIQTHKPKHYRVWFPDTMEAIGGYWWYAVTDSCGRLYNPKHPNEDRDTVQWYVDNGYKVEEVTNG